MPIPMSEIILLLNTLKAYFKSNGLKILNLAKATGQSHINIALRGLFWYYSSTVEYPKLMDVIEKILNSTEMKIKLEKYGIVIVKVNGEYYLRMKISTLERFVKEAIGRGSNS